MGSVTSAAYGHALGRAVAMGYVDIPAPPTRASSRTPSSSWRSPTGASPRAGASARPMTPPASREELEETLPDDRPSRRALPPHPRAAHHLGATKEAMLRDWGSRDPEFMALNARVRERLVALAGGQGTHVCVPLQGSGTFLVEAMLATMVPPAGKLLILVNGAYGKRMLRMCEYHRRAAGVLEVPEDGRWIRPPSTPPSRAMPRSPTWRWCTARRRRACSIRWRRWRRWSRAMAGACSWTAMSAFGALPLDAARVALRLHGGLGQQVPRGRARHGLRHRSARPRSRPPGPLGARCRWTSTTSGSPWRGRTVALHAAHPRDRRPRPGAGEHAAEGASRGGARSMPAIAASSCLGCGRWASRPCCPTPSRRPSS